MSIRMIASVVIAALLMTGGAAAVTNGTEVKIPPVKEQNIALTQEEAKNIAMNHAGFTEEEIRDIQVERDMERGVQKWDIDFRSGDWEYDYEINAETGVLIKVNKEYDPEKTVGSVESVPSKPVETKPTETQPSKTEKLSAEDAKAIALKHAGLEEAQVKGLRAEYDVDDGVPEWEVEFYEGGMEYSYEIHAESGKIRSWDKEKED